MCPSQAQFEAKGCDFAMCVDFFSLSLCCFVFLPISSFIFNNLQCCMCSWCFFFIAFSVYGVFFLSFWTSEWASVCVELIFAPSLSQSVSISISIFYSAAAAAVIVGDGSAFAALYIQISLLSYFICFSSLYVSISVRQTDNANQQHKFLKRHKIKEHNL